MKEPSPLPTALHTAAEVREMDRIAIQEQGIAGIQLMNRAGRAAFERLCEHWPRARRLLVLCGSGNNGGDGFVVATCALRLKWGVRVLCAAGPEALKGDAKLACRQYMDEGGQVELLEDFFRGCNSRRYGGLWDGPRLSVQSARRFGEEDADVIVDGLLGTGFSGDLGLPVGCMVPIETPETEKMLLLAETILSANQSGLPVLALDIPSGLCADTGRRSEMTVRADVTVSFVGLKRGLFTGDGPEHGGRVYFDSLGTKFEGRDGAVRRLLPCAMPVREGNTHKGSYGHVLVVGGNAGMAGAAVLAGRAAQRVGAGLVSLAVHPRARAGIAGACPELMVSAVGGLFHRRALRERLERATVVVLGCGLGQDRWAVRVARAVLKFAAESFRLPLVVDADALNLLARGKIALPKNGGAEDMDVEAPRLLTPHPGEAGRLLGDNGFFAGSSVQEDRFAAADKLAEKYGATVLLKGAGTLLRFRNGGIGVCPAGNPGMASGGMGDVLSGVIGGLWAQEESLPWDHEELAAQGALAHIAAANRAAEGGQRGTSAGDVIAQLRGVVNEG